MGNGEWSCAPGPLLSGAVAHLEVWRVVRKGGSKGRENIATPHASLSSRSEPLFVLSRAFWDIARLQ